ncbi:hypothetical protein ES703_125019 [subsurface metagenome]
MAKTYRPTSSYLGTTEEGRQAQMENLLRGRLRRAKKANVGAPKFNNPEYEQDVIKFCEEQFYIETRKPIVLEGWQKEEIFKPLFYSNIDYDLALISTPKKNGKSTMSAVCGEWKLFFGPDFSEIYILSRDLSQSQMIIFNKIVQSIEMNKQALVRCKITQDSIEIPHKGSVLRCLPMDISASGLSPNMVIADEIWSFEHERMRKIWDELTNIPTKKMLTMITSYAGYSEGDKEDLLWRLYKRGLSGTDPKMFFYWTHENKASWVSDAYLSQQQQRLRKNTFLRLHENRWTSGEEAFISDTAWDGCVDQKLKPSLPSKQMHITTGVDVGIKSDYSSCVSVSRNNNKIRLVTYKIWKPTKKNPIDLEVVEAYIEELAKGYILDNVLYDPWQFHRSGMSLKKQGIHTEEYPQTSDRLVKMGQLLYDLITQGNMELYPDEELRREALHTKAKETQRGWRLTKAGSGKIDAIIALAMACAGCIEKVQSRPGKVYIIGD